MKNITLFLSAVLSLSGTTFAQEQQNRFAEITNPQLIDINKLPPHAAFTSYTGAEAALNDRLMVKLPSSPLRSRTGVLSVAVVPSER